MKQVNEILSQMTLEEKIRILTGAASMAMEGCARLGVPGKNLADGPHGVRIYDENSNCVTFPSMCAIGASWNRALAEKVGAALAWDCIRHDKHMLLAPGANVKRNPLNGRNFEYVSEDPVLTGEIAGYLIKGVEDQGVGTSLKHFAVNSQETARTDISIEVDERTLREIYLRGFERAIEIGHPASLMCALNKLDGVWCSENKRLLTEILRDEWGYPGFVMSDWTAVKNECRAVAAGLDLSMPRHSRMVEILTKGLEEGKITREEIDLAAGRILTFLLHPEPEKVEYDRSAQHAIAQEAAREGVCLLRNERNMLPITAKKYKKIAVTGEYAVHPYINGQGSCEVFTDEDSIDGPLACLRRALPDVQVDYFDYLPAKQPDHMLWHYFRDKMPDIESYDLVLVFTGVQPSQDSENVDRGDNKLAGYIETVLKRIATFNPNCCLVLTSGSSTFRSEHANRFPAIVQMWPAGEGGGQAIADVLTGRVNPSGKLSETFPQAMRRDLDQMGDLLKIEYTERWRIGYRYYDLHPEEIWFPFGHGLSYTAFAYANAQTLQTADGWEVSFDLTNTGGMDGAEIVQLYVGDPVSTVAKPVKELRHFDKVFLRAGETKSVSFHVVEKDLAYYNVSLHKWIVENGRYDIYIGASSQDIRLTQQIVWHSPDCYSMQNLQVDVVG